MSDSETQNNPLSARDDPIVLYLTEQQYHGKSERTIAAYRRVLKQFREYASDTALDEVDRRSCMEWVHALRTDLADSTIATYASYVNRFYRYMIETGQFDHNPMQLVIEQMDEQIDQDPIRRDISIFDMRAFVHSINHPLTLAIVFTFLKTGIRVGELCNLDMRDVTMAPFDRPHEPTIRPSLDNRDRAMFVDSDIARGEIVNGEQRDASNKRQRATVIPIDDELCSVLQEWTRIRPDPVSAADPLFVDTGTDWGKRLHPDAVRYRIRTVAEQFGWYDSSGSSATNVTPHYFRHFFTTHLRDRTGDRGIVKYIRGDVADDIIDTYTHNWGDRVRSRYEQHIYQLL